MTIQDLGSIGELIAAIATVATLGYLAIQIRQSSRVNRLALQENYVSGLTGIFASIFSDPEVHRLWRLGMTNPDEMSEDERERLGIMYHTLFQRFALIWHSGELDSPIGKQCLAFIDQSAQFPATQSWWSRQRALYHSSFAEYVDERIRRAQASSEQRQSDDDTDPGGS